MSTELILKNISRHIQLDKTETDFFLSLLKEKTIKRKDFFLKKGEFCKNETFITRGCLRVYSIDADGLEHILMFGVEDWWVGDMYSFLTQTPSNYFIDALEDSEVLQISKVNLDKLYESVPKFERFFRIMFQNAFINQQNRINQNLSLTAEERYIEFIKKYPHLEQRIPQKQIAAYLGITPVFLSMIRRKWANQ